MIFDCLLGRTLTKVEVFDPWRQAGGPANALPLFGALAMSFGDVALFCKSPLHYCRQPGGTAIASDDGERIELGFRMDICDQEELAARQSLLESPRFNPTPLCWQRIPPPPRQGGILHNRLDIERAIGTQLGSVRFVRTPEIALDLIPVATDACLRITYREDLDGAIQFARPGWRYAISRIKLTRPEHAFGWLLDDAPYPICVQGKCWNSVERFATSFDAELLARHLARDGTPCVAERISAARVAVAIELRQTARLCKFLQHDPLARRLQALHYPVLGSDGLPFWLPEF
jgi:hypothetical protein